MIEGGRAPNVIPDKARAQLLYRLVGPSEQLKREIVETVGDLAQVEFVLEIPFVRLRTLDGLQTMVAAFTTDIPALSNWGQPLLIGPGSIHVAHTDREYVEKKQLAEGVDLYCSIAKQLVGVIADSRSADFRLKIPQIAVRNVFNLQSKIINLKSASPSFPARKPINWQA